MQPKQKKKKTLIFKYGLFVLLMVKVLPVTAISRFENNKMDSVKVKKTVTEPVYQNVDVLPQFPGGIQAFYTF